MARVRALAAVAAAAVGSAVAVADWSGLRMLVDATMRAVPVLLILVGVATVVRAATPIGARLGPLLLIAGGAFWLAFRAGNVTAEALRDSVAPALIWGGILLALIQPRDQAEGSLRTHTRTVTALLFPRDPGLGPEAPTQLTGRAILGHLTLDLTDARPPKVRPARIDVHLSLLAGGIDLVVPDGWDVLVGRVGAARGVRFAGAVAKGRFAGDGDPPKGARWLVVHALGLGGFVNVIHGRP